MTSTITPSIKLRLGALLLAACYCGASVAAPTLPQVAATSRNKLHVRVALAY